MREAVLNSLDFESQPLLLLKRKGEVVAYIYSKLGRTTALLAYLV